jgi:uncharacterized protein (DUF1778 family)
MVNSRDNNELSVVITVPATQAQFDLITQGALGANLKLNDFILSTMLRQSISDLLPKIENRP